MVTPKATRQKFRIFIKQKGQGTYSAEVRDVFEYPIIEPRDLNMERVPVSEAIAFYAKEAFKRGGLETPPIEDAAKSLAVYRNGDELSMEDIEKILREYWQN